MSSDIGSVLLCGKCGEEAFTKLIGDEVYDWCENCGCIEGCVEVVYESA